MRSPMSAQATSALAASGKPRLWLREIFLHLQSENRECVACSDGYGRRSLHTSKTRGRTSLLTRVARAHLHLASVDKQRRIVSS
jgi:hypothetical protein